MANLKKQVRKVLSSKIAYGDSKHKANRDGTASEKIFSSATYKTYIKVCNRYVDYIKTHDKDGKCHSLSKAFDAGYPTQYIDNLINRHLSPFTVSQARSALAKLHGVECYEIHDNIPRRRSKDIKRSRYPIARDLHLQSQYPDLYEAARSSGLRAFKELNRITPECICIHENGSVTVSVLSGKGGLSREVTVLGDKDLWKRLKENTPANTLIFPNIPHNSSLHACRAEFATTLYQSIARPISELKGQRIHVKDERTGRQYEFPAVYRTKDGRKYDREALIKVSQQLGHGVTRAYCVVTSYIRS